jgi:uncharacterized membrane protein
LELGVLHEAPMLCSSSWRDRRCLELQRHKLLNFSEHVMQADAPVIYSLQQAPAHILMHLAVAVAALVIGAVVLFWRKGTSLHKLLGRLWVTLMLASAISSFFIQARGRFSLIHALSILVLIAAPLGLYLARTKRIRAHRITMIAMYASLCITGLLTLLPYRMLGQMVCR